MEEFADRFVSSSRYSHRRHRGTSLPLHRRCRATPRTAFRRPPRAFVIRRYEPHSSAWPAEAKPATDILLNARPILAQPRPARVSMSRSMRRSSMSLSRLSAGRAHADRRPAHPHLAGTAGPLPAESGADLAGAVLGLALVAGWVLWQEHREEQLLSRLEIRLTPRPAALPGRSAAACATGQPHGQEAAESVMEVAAYSPGSRTNLARRAYDAPPTKGPAICNRARAGSPACRRRCCVADIAPRLWSFTPSGCKGISLTDATARYQSSPRPLILYK